MSPSKGQNAKAMEKKSKEKREIESLYRMEESRGNAKDEFNQFLILVKVFENSKTQIFY